MDQTHLLDSIPLWGLFLATVAIVILSVEADFRLGRFRRLRYVGGFAAGHGVMRLVAGPARGSRLARWPWESTETGHFT